MNCGIINLWVIKKFVEHYTNYGYMILKDRFKLLEKHHQEETNFLINEVRKLAEIVDNMCSKIGKYNETQNN